MLLFCFCVWHCLSSKICKNQIYPASDRLHQLAGHRFLTGPNESPKRVQRVQKFVGSFVWQKLFVRWFHMTTLLIRRKSEVWSTWCWIYSFTISKRTCDNHCWVLNVICINLTISWKLEPLHWKGDRFMNIICRRQNCSLELIWCQSEPNMKVGVENYKSFEMWTWFDQVFEMTEFIPTFFTSNLKLW